MTVPTRQLFVDRRRDGAWSHAEDTVAVEEPLEIRVAGDTVAITMRTPGHDRELALGFLFSEGILRSIDDVSSVAHCGRATDEGRLNTLDVTPAPGVRIVLGNDEPFARRGTISSACGVCGRRSIDDLLARCTPIANDGPVELRHVFAAVEELRTLQPLFGETGGCHGAGLFTRTGDPIEVFEDVGRHNAVDKLIGSQLLEHALPLRSRMLVVSGRTSFEIVQKAAVAGIPVVAGVSAPSTLAIDVATRAGITLVGFVRGESLVVYTGRERIA
jgi:FdhD protein